MRTTYLYAGLLLATGFLMAGCGPSNSREQEKTICFAFQDLETEFWVASHKAITETLRDQQITVIERNASQDANRQLEQVRDCIAQDVDGIILIPQDGESAVSIIREANRAGVPIGIYNRPPAGRRDSALVIVADNEKIAEDAMAHMAEEARKLGRKVTPLLLVGDLGDPNAIARRKGVMNVIKRNPELFNPVVEVPTKWDAPTALANLESALQANPNVDLIFNSSDFMHPQVRAVLEPLGKWKKIGEPGHIILGGIDGDQGACRLMKEGYVDATGVQDLFFEAETMLGTMLEAVAAGRETPSKWMNDPGFALTQANLAQRANDMWGCRLLADQSAQ